MSDFAFLTSGLDSTTAARIVGALRRMAADGRRTVVVTLHQPSSRLYHMFDKVLLLSAEGCPIYYGRSADALPYFASVGFASRLSVNPADLMLDLANRKIPSVAPAPKRPKKNVLLFYCEEMRELAERVVLESDSIELRSISWRFTLPRRRKLNDQVCTGAKKSEELSKLAARKLSNSFNLNTKGTQMRRLVRFPWHV